MSAKNSLVLDFGMYLDKVENRLNTVVENGDDNELFIASYFHGHFSLAASQVNPKHPDPYYALDVILTDNLREAFVNGELTEPDQALVWALWDGCKTN
jgi:hypothetical protein